MKTINDVFSPETFRNQAHALVDTLADYLIEAQNRTEKAIPYQSPEDSLSYWEADYANGLDDNPADLFKKIIEQSTHLHNPRYMGHQVGVVAPLAATTSMLSSLLNNGMAVYEMGLVSNPLEKIVTASMAKRIGFDDQSGGLLTSGGTLANLTALLAARAKKASTDVWHLGTDNKLAIMVSEEAHYCVDRAARIMGLGTEGIIKVPTNASYQLQSERLGEYYDAATAKGLEVIAIIGSSCSTSTGSYDDLQAIGKFARDKNIWFHVDGAHGGAVIYSEKYKHKVAGIELADSVVIDWHKMLLTPALVTALIFKNNEDSFQTFHQKAQYLWSNQTSQDWFNSGKRTFECTKLMMSVKVYTLLKTYGEQLLGEHVDYLYDLGQEFGKMISDNPKFELGTSPECNIVCFKTKNASNETTQEIRKKLLHDGKFYIVETKLKEQAYLRVSLMNPLTTKSDLAELLGDIERLG